MLKSIKERMVKTNSNKARFLKNSKRLIQKLNDRWYIVSNIAMVMYQNVQDASKVPYTHRDHFLSPNVFLLLFTKKI